MYVTDELDAELINRFQHIIGVIRWSIEIGSIDIITEVSCLSQHLCSPQEGHLNAVYKIFSYLNQNISKNPGRIGFDPDCVRTDDNSIEISTIYLKDWKDLFTVPVYVDENHTGNLANRRSHSGILIYVNNALIKFYNKRYNTF